MGWAQRAFTAIGLGVTGALLGAFSAVTASVVFWFIFRRTGYEAGPVSLELSQYDLLLAGISGGCGGAAAIVLWYVWLSRPDIAVHGARAVAVNALAGFATGAVYGAARVLRDMRSLWGWLSPSAVQIPPEWTVLLLLLYVLAGGLFGALGASVTACALVLWSRHQ